MNKKTAYISFIFLFLFPLLSFSQLYDREVDDYDADQKPYKLGVKAGMTVSGVISDGLKNGYAMRGMHGAFYYRKQLNKKLHFHTEIGGAISGARFRNGDTGYSRFSTLYLELPQTIMISLDQKFHNSVFVGLQPSVLLRSQLYVGNDPYASFFELPLNRINVMAVAGYHFNTDVVGFRLAFKYGLLNMNQDLQNYKAQSVNYSVNTNIFFEKLSPPFNISNPIHNWMVDISIYF